MPIFNFTRRAATAAVAILGTLAGLPGTASASIFRGQISDPIERPTDPSRDITNLVTAFDNANGRWTTQVTFAAAPTAATSERLYLSLVPPQGQCPLGAGVIGMQLESGAPFTRYTLQSCAPGAPQTVQRALVGSTLSLQVTDSAAIGLTPTKFGGARLSHHMIYDVVPSTRLFAPDAAATFEVGPVTRFALTNGRVLHLPLTGVPRTARASMRLTVAGTVLARRTLTIRPGMPSVRLHLAAGALRHLHTGSTIATLKTTLRHSTSATRTITQKITLVKL